MKGYRKLFVRPGTAELAARRKRREEERAEFAKLQALLAAANYTPPGGEVTAPQPAEAKDATQP